MFKHLQVDQFGFNGNYIRQRLHGNCLTATFAPHMQYAHMSNIWTVTTVVDE